MSTRPEEKEAELSWKALQNLTDEQMTCQHNYAGYDRKGVYWDHCGICAKCEIEADLSLDGQCFSDYADGYLAGVAAEAKKAVELRKELSAVSAQIADCMEFLIWLKGYEYTDGLIDERLDALLRDLVAKGGE